MADVAALLAQARSDLAALEEQRNRLARELALIDDALRARDTVVPGFGVVAGDVGELQTRADASRNLIDVIENFVGDVFGRVEARAQAGDEAAAQRLADSTRKILVAVGGVSPLSDLRSDVVRFVKDTARDAEKAAGFGIGTALAVYLGVEIVKALVAK